MCENNYVGVSLLALASFFAAALPVQADELTNYNKDYKAEFFSNIRNGMRVNNFFTLGKNGFGRGGVMIGAAADLTPTLDKLHTDDPTNYPNGSAYEYANDANSTNYTFTTPNENGTTNYHKINLKPSAFSTSNSINWTTGTSASNFVYDSTTGIGTGAIGIELPSNGTATTQYYTYIYTKPNNYELTTSGVYNLNSDNVTNKVFYNSTVSNSNDSSDVNIIADFIGSNAKINQSGRPYSETTVYKLGNITGNFIGTTTNAINNNISTFYNNQAYNSAVYIGNIFGNFIGNSGTVIQNNSGGYAHTIAEIDDITGNFLSNTGTVIYNYGSEYGSCNANIGNITGNFIANNGVVIYNSGYNIIKNITGDFINNTKDVIYNSIGSGYLSVGKITGDFINNKPENGVISNSAGDGGRLSTVKLSLGDITGKFINNKTTSTNYYGSAGAIRNYSGGTNAYVSSLGISLGDINADFINNSSNGNQATAGAISNLVSRTKSGTYISVGNIKGNFIGNSANSGSGDYSAGAIANVGLYGGSTTISSITGDFINNSIFAQNVYTIAGAILNREQNNYSYATINRVSGNFIGNYAKSTNSNSFLTGAIYNNGTMTLLAENGNEYLISGNIAEDNDGRRPVAIALGNGTFKILAKTNGVYDIKDQITAGGAAFFYLTGDSTGTVKLHNDIINTGARGFIDTITVDLLNNETNTYNFYQLTSNANTKYKIDIDLGTKTADKFVINSNYYSSTGTITLHDINFNNYLDTNQAKIQVIDFVQGSGVRLAFSDDMSTNYVNNEFLISSSKIGEHSANDNILAQTTWNKTYNACIVDDMQSAYARLTLATTKTTNDSIGINITRTIEEDGAKTIVGSLGDTLKLVIADTTNASKEFNANADGATYTVGDNLGTLSGNLTINGVSGGSTETVNLNNKTGMTIAGANTLNLNNVKITDNTTGKTAANTTIATVTNSNANINLDGAELNGNIVSTSGYNLSLKGNTTLGGSIGTAKVTTDNTTLKFAANTFTNADVTTDANSTFDLTTDGIKTYNFGTLTSDADTDWAIDINLANKTADTIKVGSDSTGTVTLSNLNFNAGSSLDDIPSDLVGQTYVIKILDAQSDNIKLALSSAVQGQLGDENYRIGTVTNNVNDVVLADNTWDTDYRNYTQQVDTYGKLGLATSTGGSTNDSIGVTYHHTDTLAKVDVGSQGDIFAVVNQADIGDRNLTTDDSTKTHIITEALGTTASGKLTIQGATDGENTSTVNFDGNSGFVLANADTVLTIKNVNLTGADGLINATTADSIVNFDEVATSNNGIGIVSAGTVNIKDSIINDTLTMNNNGQLNVNGTSELNDKVTLNDNSKLNISGNGVTVNGKITGDDTAELNLTDSDFEVKNNIENVNVNLNNSTLKIADESLFNASLVLNSPSTIDMMNNNISTFNVNNLTLNSDLNLKIDADLALKTIDKLNVNNLTVNSGKINVEKINIIHPTTDTKTSLLFTNNSDLANAVNYTGEGEIAYSPIFRYKTSYSVKDGEGYFDFVLPSQPGPGPSPSPTPSDFNPAVLTTPTMTQAGMMANMNATMNYAFQHSDGFTKLSAMDRFAAINANKYALAETGSGTSTDFNQNMANLAQAYENKGAWVRPYASFENIGLKNGPRVDAISYGTLVGFDTNFKELRNGWDTVFTGYVGYNGAHLNYTGVTTTMNGGMLGGTQTWYKGNFWTALTATAGASVAESDTMYGHDSNVSLMTGIGSKTGYNFEFKQGKFIVQPIWFMNYSMIKTFDYTNAAGVRIDSDPLHTIQLNPSVRFIGNLKHGWQPYASVGMVWNLMNETQAKANGVKLPEMSVKPYVEYGVGVQKQVGDRFTGFFQAMMRNGGRNGIALTGGFRWALGRDSKPVQKVQGVNIKQAKATSSTSKIKSDKKILNKVKNDEKQVQNAKLKNKSALKSRINRFFAKMNGEQMI